MALNSDALTTPDRDVRRRVSEPDHCRAAVERLLSLPGLLIAEHLRTTGKSRESTYLCPGNTRSFVHTQMSGCRPARHRDRSSLEDRETSQWQDVKISELDRTTVASFGSSVAWRS